MIITSNNNPYYHSLTNQIIKLLTITFVSILARSYSSASSTSLQHSYQHSSLSSALIKPSSPSSDLICNSGTQYACVCQKFFSNAPNYYPLCNELIQVGQQISAILLKMRRINLQALLHTNETYESYLKRRLANVMTNYCEQQINECPATTIRLDKVIITNKNSLISRKRMDNDDEKKEILKQLLEQQRQTNFERIFTQANIVILNVTTDFDRSTTIAFVILRQTNSDNNNNHNLSKTFNSNDLIDAVKVKYVLSAQVPSLSRVLGGVRIERIAIETIRNDNIRTSSSSPTMNTNNNSKLYIILGATAAFLLTTYIIAAIKVCREYIAKKRHEKCESNLRGSHNNLSNYGSCKMRTDSAYDYTNQQHFFHKHHKKELLISEGQQTDENYLQYGGIPLIRYTPRMFQCDHSQLPAEQISINDFSKNLNSLQTTAVTIPETKISQISPEIFDEKNLKTPNIVRQIACNKGKFEAPKNDYYLTENQVIRSRTAHVFEHWSSESDNEDHIDYYYKLAEDEVQDDREDLHHQEQQHQQQLDQSSPPLLDEEKNDTADATANYYDSENDDHEDISDSHGCYLYKKLQESPQPSPNHHQNSSNSSSSSNSLTSNNSMDLSPRSCSTFNMNS